ncbi:MAG TPA: SEC-C metal-binding domain-containing protein [Thermoclostridium caenicola]|nr:SEC-C metal-binding domain-containing protein [Thermoclostridium caenicola]
MSLYKDWRSKLENNRETEADKAFFNNYIQAETEAYRRILKNNEIQIRGKLSELAEAYQMDDITFMGFLDGIRTSLDNDLDLESLEPDSEIQLDINLEKLFYNMLEAKAHWLYGLEEWDERLSAEKRREIRKKFNEDHRAVSSKVGRNDPCPCGSGKKYKKCCGA